MKKMLKSCLVCLLTVGFLANSAVAEENDLTKTVQERVAKLSPEQQAALLALLDQLTATKAAATAAKAPLTPEEAGRQALAEFEAAKKENKFDLDLFMSHFSEDFDHFGTGKEGARTFIAGMMASIGTLGSSAVTISMDKAKYKISGDKVEAYPIDVTTPVGSLTLTIHGKLEDGVWRVVGVDGI